MLGHEVGEDGIQENKGSAQSEKDVHTGFWSTERLQKLLVLRRLAYSRVSEPRWGEDVFYLVVQCSVEYESWTRKRGALV